MSWDMNFINPPKRYDLLSNVNFKEAEEINGIRNEGFHFLYVEPKNEDKSGAWVQYDEEGYLIYGCVNYAMNVTPFGRALFTEFNTFTVDDDYYSEYPLGHICMEKDEEKLFNDFKLLSYEIGYGFVKKEDEWAKEILSKTLDYLMIVDKYDLYFNGSVFMPPYSAIKKLEQETIEKYKFTKTLKYKMENIIGKFKKLKHKETEDELPF